LALVWVHIGINHRKIYHFPPSQEPTRAHSSLLWESTDAPTCLFLLSWLWFEYILAYIIGNSTIFLHHKSLQEPTAVCCEVLSWRIGDCCEIVCARGSGWSLVGVSMILVACARIGAMVWCWRSLVLSNSPQRLLVFLHSIFKVGTASYSNGLLLHASPYAQNMLYSGRVN